MINALTRQD